jgi:hypothetical protein
MLQNHTFADYTRSRGEGASPATVNVAIVDQEPDADTL